MQETGKFLFVTGLIVILIGMIFYFGWASAVFGWMGRLPGDIRIERENGGFYFPVTTCIVISVILTVIFRIIFWIRTSG